MNVNMNTPKYSMALKLENDGNKMINTPGPGRYDPNFEMNARSASAYSMAQRPRSARVNMNQPGPGDYEIKGNLEKPSYK